MLKKKMISAVMAAIIGVMCLPVTAGAASDVKGDANGDGKIDVRDAAYIASGLSKQLILGSQADYNEDGKVDIRDAAAIANKLVLPYSSNVTLMLKLVNDERAKAGVPPLSLNPTLVAMADIRAAEAAESFSHTRPDGTSCFTVFDDFNMSYSYCGENLAAGSSTPEGAFRQWIESEGHYENMVDPNYTEIGVGYCYDPDSVYKYHWVQIFRKPF
ncbi:MAG: CAP domain-containing protein [Porcipelethomonas sp.]